MRNQRKWGAALSYVNICATLAVGLLYTPVMLRLLGQSEYGLYALIGSFAGYLGVLDLGLGNTIVRYTARNRAVGTSEREAELNGLFLVLYSGIGLLTVIVGGIMYSQMETLFGATLDAGEMARARIMMLLLIGNFAFTFPLSIFASIMQAYERFIFLRVVNILRVLLNPCIVLPLLLLGYGSVMMVVVTTVLNLACLLTNVWYARHFLHVRFRWGRFERPFLREVAVYSFFIFLNAIMDKVYWGSGQFVLGMVSGTIEVAIYAVAMQFMMIYMQFSSAISGVLLPKVTMLVAEGTGPKALTELFTRVGRLQYIVVAYILILFILVGREFITLWAGADSLAAYPIVVLLMAALFIALVQNTGIAILQAENRNRYRMTAYTMAAALSFIVSFPLASLWGGWGCAVATALALFISTGFVMNRYYQRVIGLDIPAFWRSLAHMSIGPGLLLFGGCLLQAESVHSYSWHHFIWQAVAYSAAYGLLLYGLSLNQEEKQLFHSAVLRLPGARFCQRLWRSRNADSIGIKLEGGKSLMHEEILPRIRGMVAQTAARCTGCTACANVCPRGAITMQEGAEGFRYPSVDAAQCVQCGLCDRTCPSLAMYPEAWAFWHEDEAVRQCSSSGGAFTALAQYVLSRGGSAFGAAFDYEHDGQVRHVEIEDAADLSQLQTSKYAASTLGDIYQKVLARLKEGKLVLFSGTPCQTEGLLSAGGVHARQNLILVDFICHGVPSPGVWREYVKIRMKNRRLRRISMRRQNLSWERFCLELTDDTSRQYLAPLDRDPYLQAFLQDIILRPSCYQCPHRRLARSSDFTLADFWGVDHVMPGWNDHQGTSLVLCHSERAREIMETLPGRKERAPLEEAIRYNPALLRSPVCPEHKRKAFFTAYNESPEHLLEHLHKVTSRPMTYRVYRRARHVAGCILRRLHLRR